MDIWGRLQKFGLIRIAIIAAASLAVAALIGIMTVQTRTSNFGLLFADLDYANAQAVIDRLQSENLPYRLAESNGRVTIMTPRDAIATLRIDLAADGIISASTVGYEIFDDTDALGSTAFQQNINRLRALEGELARTITAIAGVRSARVHLVLPERALFARERTPASASIMIDAPGGLEARSVRAVVNLVAAAVPELGPNQVTVLDASGTLLSASRDENDVFLSSIEEKTTATQARLRQTVEDLVGRIVGPENVRVQVAADLDLNRITENAEIIDPDSQTVLSETIIEESGEDSRPGAGAGVSVANALPGANDAAQTASNRAASSNRRTEEVTNYEISKTIRSAVREQGGIRRLSVAVALNRQASPRTAEEIETIGQLVRSAVGFDAARGDQISIAEMAFSGISDAATTNPAGTLATSSTAPSSVNVTALAQLAAVAVIALAIIFFVIRPAVSGGQNGAGATLASLSARTQEAVSASAARPATAGAAGIALPGASDPALTGAAYGELPNRRDSEIERRIDLAQVEGQVKASSLRKVADLVKTHADESSGIVKSWIREAV